MSLVPTNDLNEGLMTTMVKNHDNLLHHMVQLNSTLTSRLTEQAGTLDTHSAELQNVKTRLSSMEQSTPNTEQLKNELKDEVKDKVKDELKNEVSTELRNEMTLSLDKKDLQIMVSTTSGKALKRAFECVSGQVHTGCIYPKKQFFSKLLPFVQDLKQQDYM